MDRKKILKDKKVSILVVHSGMRQNVDFEIVREQIPGGEIPFLKTDRNINAQELLRVAQLIKLPIIAPAGKFFPQKMGMKDFLGL
jgi:hypothetical protein